MKASLSNDNLCVLLMKMKIVGNTTKHRIKSNRNHVRDFYGEKRMTDLQCDKYIRSALGEKRSHLHSVSDHDTKQSPANSKLKQSLGKKRTASGNRQHSNKKLKISIKSNHLKSDNNDIGNNETDDNATNKQKQTRSLTKQQIKWSLTR
jgi:hypothetical protein